jgi:hypothetical protein
MAMELAHDALCEKLGYRNPLFRLRVNQDFAQVFGY